jgi:type I restriction enzyme M protein
VPDPAHRASADLLRISCSEGEARRYFTLVGQEEIAENEFNLNLPRYVDTFEPETVLLLNDAAAQLKSAAEAAVIAQAKLVDLLRAIGQEDAR